MKRFVDDIGCALLWLLVLLVLTIVIGPFLYVLVMSTDPRAYLGSFPPPGFSGRWYAKFFADERYMRALQMSLGIAILSSSLATLLGTLAALGMSRMRTGTRNLADALFASPQLVPHVVIGFAVLLTFAAAGTGTGFVAITCVHMLITLPLVIRSVSAALLGIRPSLTEAAMSLGATRTRAVADVVLPLARTGIAVGFVFAVAVSLDEVSATVFLTTPSVVTLPVTLVSDMKASFDLTIAAAAAVLVVLAAVVVLVLELIVGIERLLGRGVYGGGIESKK